MTDRVGRAKVALYVTLPPDVPLERVATTGRAQAAIASQSLPNGVEQRLAVLTVPETPLPHQRLMAASPRPFDLAYQLAAGAREPLAAMADAVAAMLTALQPDIDARHAAVLIGEEIAITSGDGPIYNIMPLRRLAAISHDEFMHQWFDRHAALGEGVEGVRYRQNHVDAAATDSLAERLGLTFPAMDGLTESYFDDVAAAVSVLSQNVVAHDAIEDERRFIDHARSQFGLYETIWHASGR